MHAFYGKRISSFGGKPITSVIWCDSQDQLIVVESGGQISALSSVGMDGNFVSVHVAAVGNANSEQVVLASIANGEAILTGDSLGVQRILLRKGAGWQQNANLERKGPPVEIIKVNPAGSQYCVLYGTGDIDVRSSSGALISSWRSKFRVRVLEWSPDGHAVLAGNDESGEVSLHDLSGNTCALVPAFCLEENSSTREVAAIDWYSGAEAPGRPLLIAFRVGRCQLLRSEFDSIPILLDCMCSIHAAHWSPSGGLIALATELQIHFYSGEGVHLKSVPSPAHNVFISCINWGGIDDTLVVAANSTLFILDVHRPTQKCWFADSFCLQTGARAVTVYSLTRTKRVLQLDEPVLFIRANKSTGTVAIVTSGHLTGTSRIRILDAIGNSLSSTPVVCLDKISSFDILGGAFFVSNGQSVVVQYEDANVAEIDISAKDDKVTDLAVSGVQLAVARESGLIHVCVPNQKRYYCIVKNLLVPTLPVQISLNCNDTQLAVVSMESGLSLLDLGTGETQATRRLQCVDFQWATDSPNHFVCIDKNRLYVHRGLKAEEPIEVRISDNVLCNFDNLKVATFSKSNQALTSFFTKTSRDLTDLTTLVGNWKDAIDYADNADHPALWTQLAMAALLSNPMNMDLAGTCFERSHDDAGIAFVAQLRMIENDDERKIQVFFHYQRVNECEVFLKAKSLSQLLLQMYMKVGNYAAVEKLVIEDPNVYTNLVDQRELTRKLGDMHFANRQLDTAIEYYAKVNPVSRNYVEALVRTNNYQKISQLIGEVKDKQLLRDIGNLCLYAGLGEAASKAYQACESSASK